MVKFPKLIPLLQHLFGTKPSGPPNRVGLKKGQTSKDLCVGNPSPLSRCFGSLGHLLFSSTKSVGLVCFLFFFYKPKFCATSGSRAKQPNPALA